MGERRTIGSLTLIAVPAPGKDSFEFRNELDKLVEQHLTQGLHAGAVGRRTNRNRRFQVSRE